MKFYTFDTLAHPKLSYLASWQHLTQGLCVAATFSASSKVSGKCLVFVSGHNHKLTTPENKTIAPYITNGTTGDTESNIAINGDDNDPTRAPADAVPKAVVLKMVGNSS